VGRAIDSGRWADSLVEFVDAAKASGQKNAIANLSLDLTQKNADGSVTTRYELTPQERSAIEYARQNGVMLVVAAGNDGGVMSVLGQASQEFDNIFTVGAGDINGRSNYSSYGRGLDILADGGTTEHPGLSTVGNDLGTMAGTSVATAKVAGAASLVWAANPALNYRQVMEILESTARDLGPSGWDDETGFGFLNTLAAVDLAKKTQPEVYQPTPWVTPDTWSGEGKVTPEERAAKGGNSIAAATVQVSTNFSDIDRVDSNQPQKYYQFTVNEPGYVRWNLTSLNPVSGFPSPPNVTIIKANGRSASRSFHKGATVSMSAIGEGQTSFSGGDFYDPGTYYLKVGGGAFASFQDYNISTQFSADKVSSFAGNVQYRTQAYKSLDDSQTAVFSGPTVSELNNLSGQVTYNNTDFNSRVANYGFEVNESGKFRIKLNSPNGKMQLNINKFIGSEDRPVQISGLEASPNYDGWLEVDLNKGRYEIEVATPSDFWGEPDWNSTQQTLVRPYTLNGIFTPNAPQPGQGKVPSSAGAFDKTVVSNGVVNHYYKNGYLTVQPSGEASWYSYGTGNAIGVIEISAVPLPFEIPPDYAGNSPDMARDIGTLIGTQTFHDVIDRNDRFDYYKFNITSESKVDFALSGKMGNTGFYLFQDWYFNSDDSTHIDIISGTPPNGVVPEFSQTLKPGSYYVLVHKPKDYDGDEYDLKLSATPLGDPDGNDSIQTAENLSLVSGGADLGDGVNSNQVGIGYILSSIGGKDLNDFYKFSIDSLKLVNFYLSQSGTAAQWWLIQDRNGNGQVDPGEAIKTGTITTKPLDLDVILGAGDYYLQVGSLSSDATSVYAVNVAARSLENQVIASYNSDYYLVQNGQLRLIPNQETLTEMGIAANTVKTFSNQDLTLIPYGDDLPSRKNGDVFGDLSGRIYLMESGKRRLVPDWDTLRAIGINVTYFPMFPESDIKDIELGDPYAPPIPQWQKDIDNTYQYTRNLLGNPTGSYWQAGSSPNGTQGYGQNYDNGTIYWTAQSGAIALWYAFKDTYNQTGGSNGWLGFPTKGKETDSSGGQRIDFEGGYIYWTEKEGAKAYHTGETINRKPVITSFPDFQMPYGASFSLQTYVDRLQISDPDGDAIQFYEISVDPSRVGMEAWTLEGQPLGKYLIPADKFNTINFYGSVLGSNPVVVRVFDGKEWSDPKSFNITVVPSSNTGGVAITPGNGGSPSTTSPSPTPEQPISGKGVTIRTGANGGTLIGGGGITGIKPTLDWLDAKIKQLTEDINKNQKEIDNIKKIPFWEWWPGNNEKVSQLERQKKELEETRQGKDEFEKKHGHYINISKRKWSDKDWEEAINDYTTNIVPYLNLPVDKSKDSDLRKLYEDLSTALVGQYYTASGGYIADSYFNATGGVYGYHGAIDINVPSGKPVKAIVDGIVVETNLALGDLTIQASDGSMYLYRHLSTSGLSAIEKNKTKVYKGIEISGITTGSTATNAPHLHYEVIKPGQSPQGELADRTGSNPEELKQKIRDQTKNPLQDYWEKMWLGK
jgi:murein DD-endopeptidase MepM/ murein hydrolase activator NlpD